MSMIEEAEKEMVGQPAMFVFNRNAAPKKSMLFLDDRALRIRSAIREFSPPWRVTIATNVKECLRYLARQDFDEVHLEHDLRGIEFADPASPETGMEVVRYISKTGWPPNKRKPIFIVHSSNLFAAYLMVTTLQEIGLFAFYRPFEEGEPTQ